MNITKEDLLKALEAVKPGLANKEFIEQVTAFAFVKGHVVTYNDEISVAYPIEGLDIEGAIKAEEMYALITRIKDAKEKKDQKMVSLTATENEILITYGKIKAGFLFQSEVKLPLDNEIAQRGDWQDLPKSFTSALDFVKSSVRKDQTRPILTCVHVNGESQMVEASDGYRLARYYLEDAVKINPFLIPRSVVNTIIQFTPVQIAEGKGWIHFKSSYGSVLSCRIFEDAFPQKDGLLAVEGTILTLPPNIVEVIDRASVFSKREIEANEKVTISLEDNKLRVESALEVGGWFEEEVRFRYTGEPISFSAAPYLLREVLSKSQSFIKSDNKLKFEGNNWVYIAALTTK